MKSIRGLLIMVLLLSIGLVAGGCDGKKKKRYFAPLESPGASGVVGLGGGSVSVNDPTNPINGAGVDFPSGAFSSDTTVTIGRWLQDIEGPPDTVRCSEIINVSAGEEPQTSFTIILPYIDENNDGLEDETNVPEVLLMPYRYEESNASWVEITKVSQDMAANTVTATSDKLGKFALFGPVIDATVQPELATNPSPTDALPDVPITVTLGWDFPANTTSFDLYFGVDRAAVETATTNSSEFTGNITVNYFPLPTLSSFTTYYWRVDSVNQSGKTRMSTAWSFATEVSTAFPDQVTNPAPTDEEQDVLLNQTLTWDCAANADGYDVYLGTTQGAVITADVASPEFMGNVTPPYFTQPADLDQNTTYYWRIDSRNTAGETAGVVWSFHTIKTLPAQATNPTPAGGTTGLPLNITLQWDCGAALPPTDSFDIYFGNNATDVANADTGTPIIYRGNQTGTSFPLPALSEATTYYWRIDSLNVVGTTKGLVWSFGTGQLPAVATLIDPPDGGPGEEIVQTLAWNNASFATGYDVYFGNDQLAVQNATPLTPVIYRGEVFTNSWAAPALTEATSYYWRIDSKNSVGTVAGTVWSFATGVLPEQALSPVPADLANYQPLSLTLQWSAANTTTSYVYLGDNQSLVSSNDPSVYLGSTAGTSIPSGALASITTYYWRVNTENAVGSVTGAVWSFDTGDYPPAVVGMTPGNLAIITTPAQLLSWSCGGAVTDSFDVYLGTDFATVQAEDTGNANGFYMGNQIGTSFDPGGLAPDTSYYWRVDAVNTVGATQGLMLEFYTIPLPPPVTNLTPGDGATHINALSINITWDCGGAYTDQFHVFFSASQVEVATRDPAAYQGPTVSLQWPASGLSTLTSYYWAVDANNNFGNTTGAEWEFSTTDLPPAAQNIYPTDGNSSIIDPTPTLTWDCGAAPPPTDTFDLYFSGTQNLVDTLDISALSQSGTLKFWTAPALAAGTSYYWRVVAFNGVGNDSGTTWSFGTEPLPQAPILSSPADGEQWVNTTSPSLDWTCGGVITDSFDVFFGDSLVLVQNEDTGNATGMYMGNQTGISYATSGLVPGTDYFWRIDAVGDMGTNSSAVWTFRVTPLPPLPINYSPTIDNQWVSDTNPALDWTNGGAVTDSFDVYFGSDFSAVNSATIISAEFIENTTGNTSSIQPVYLPLTPGTSYYWRVDSINLVGTNNNVAWSFRVTPLPPLPINFAPGNESWGISTAFVLDWDCNGELTDGFNVYFGTDMDCVNDATPANGYGEFIGYQTTSDYSPGMAPGTTYFWRIESVNTMGNSNGGLYWFRTEGPPLLSYSPNPGNSSTGVNTILTLSWENDDPTVTDYGVFLGTNATEVANEDWGNGTGTYMGLTGGGNSWSPPQLQEGTTYYWHIDAVNGYGNSAGGLWWFRTGVTFIVSITSIEPNSGLCSGLTFVNIYGDDFDCNCTVEIGGNPAYSVTYQNENWLTCFTPAGAIGCATVFVDRSGLSNDSLVGGYSYEPFPSGAQVNTNQAVRWAGHEDPFVLFNLQCAAITYFSDNRRAPISNRWSSEIYWATEFFFYGGPWTPNVEIFGAYNAADLPDRRQPQVIRGTGGDLYMIWQANDFGTEGIYFSSSPNGFVWTPEVLVADMDDVFGTWIEETGITFLPGAPDELSVFIMSGNEDDITQITRFISVNDGATWPASDNVTDASDPLWDMDVGLNSLGGTGVIYANVTDMALEECIINFKYWDGSSWNGPYRVDSDPSQIMKGFPELAVGSDDTLYAAWIDNRNGNFDVFFTKSFDNGATWNTDSEADLNLADTFDFDLMINGTDQLWIGMADDRGTAYWSLCVTTSIDWGNTWGAPVVGPDPTGTHFMQIHGDALDNGSIIYVGISDNDVYAATSTNGGAAWLPAVRITDDVDDQNSGAPDDEILLARNVSTDTLCTLWLTGQPQGAGKPQIRAAVSADNGTTWTGDPTVNDIIFLPPEDPDEPVGQAVFVSSPTLLANVGAAAFFAAWTDGRDTSGSDWDQTQSVYFNWADGSGNWQAYPNISVSDNAGAMQENDPHLAMDNAGNMLCIWTEYDGPVEWSSNPDRIRVAKSTDYGLTWTGHVYVDTDPGTRWRRYPKLVFDGSRGIWIAAWLDSRTGSDNWDYDVYSAISTDGGASWINEGQVNVDTAPQMNPPLITVIDPSDDRLYVFWSGIGYQFSDDGTNNWNGSDTWVDNSGWPAGFAQSFDISFTQQGVCQLVFEHQNAWPPTEWQTLLQRGFPGTGFWLPPITVVDPLDADETVLKYGGSLIVKEEDGEVIVVWPDARDDTRYDVNTNLFSTRGR